MKLKVIVDTDCSLYIDGELRKIIPTNVLTFVNLERGEYIIRLECKDLPTVFREEDILLEYDKVLRVNFLDTIKSDSKLLESLDLELSFDGEKYGYKVSKTNLLIVPCKYEQADKYWSSSINGKISVVSIDGLFGIINRKEVFVIPPEYEELKIFEHYIYAYCNGVRHILTKEYADVYQDNERIPDIYDAPPHAYAYAGDHFFAINKQVFFQNGEKIEELKNVNIYRSLCREQGYLDAPFYTATKDSMWGIVMINGKTRHIQWICDYCLEYRGDQQGPQSDPFCDFGLDVPEWNLYRRWFFFNPSDNKDWLFTYYPELRILVKSVPCHVTNNNALKVDILGYNNTPKFDYYDVTLYNDDGIIIFHKERIVFDGYFGYVAHFKEDNSDIDYVVDRFGAIKIIHP